MTIDLDLALERVLGEGDDWQSWRALALSKEAPGEPPAIAGQDQTGAFVGPAGRPSPGATGENLCHLVVVGLEGSDAARRAADWLIAARTPAHAWLDHPEEVPTELDSPAAARVWATASASCALLSAGRDPGPRAIDLLRGEADQQGRFTGGGYTTCAAAGAYWLAQGPKTEMAEWALRWARESDEEDWDEWSLASALTFWGAARIPYEHPSVETFVDRLAGDVGAQGWEGDLELTLRALELLVYFER